MPTTCAGDARARSALEAGARAHALKNHARRDLLDTIRRVFAGHKYVDPAIAG